MFFETTIMGKTADLAMIQKTNIDALHKEGKTHRGSLLKGVAVYRVLYQSILNAKLTGRKNLGRKRCTSNRDDRKLENTVKQSWFKHLWELHKEWTEAGVSASESPRSDVFRKGLPSHFWTRDNVRSILPELWRKRTGLLLSGPKSSFQMKVNFAFHLEIKVQSLEGLRVERHRIHVAWSPVWSFHSQWWFGVQCHLLVLVHCVFFENQRHCTRLPRYFGALHASFCWPAF